MDQYLWKSSLITSMMELSLIVRINGMRKVRLMSSLLRSSIKILRESWKKTALVVRWWVTLIWRNGLSEGWNKEGLKVKSNILTVQLLSMEGLLPSDIFIKMISENFLLYLFIKINFYLIHFFIILYKKKLYIKKKNFCIKKKIIYKKKIYWGF